MAYRRKTMVLAVIAALFIGLFLVYDLKGDLGYVLPRRILKVVAIILTGGAIAIATTIFMTITNNRILTPSVFGLDSVYMLTQTALIYLFGSQTLVIMNSKVNYLLSLFIMILFAFALYQFLFRGGDTNIYLLLLIGIILGTFFNSLTTFMQVLIDPNEFMKVQDKMFASINNVNTDLVYFSIGITVLVLLYFLRFYKYMDVLALGKDQAVSLGVPYHYVVKRLLIIVAVLISIATALIGPITFLGLLVVNLAYEFYRTFRHFYIFIGSVLMSIIALVGGEFILEKIFSMGTTISVIINFSGGVYFIYLLLKGSRAW